jgi:hypothetical protein
MSLDAARMILLYHRRDTKTIPRALHPIRTTAHIRTHLVRPIAIIRPLIHIRNTPFRLQAQLIHRRTSPLSVGSR